MKVAVALLIIFVSGLVVIQTAGSYVYNQPTVLNFAIVPYCSQYPSQCQSTTTAGTFSVSTLERWDVFNSQGQVIQTLTSSTKQFSLFGLLPPQLSVITQGAGFIRVSEVVTLGSAMPASSFWDEYETTVQLAGTVSIGSSQFQVDYVRNPLAVSLTSFGFGGLGYQVFSSSDVPGTQRLMSFYIILSRAAMPADCSYQPSACIDATSFVQQGTNFPIQTNIQETWKVIDYANNPLYQTTQTCPGQITSLGGGLGNTCVVVNSNQQIGVQYSAQLSNFATYYTSNSHTYLSQSVSYTTPQSDTIRFLTTCGGVPSNSACTTLVAIQNPTTSTTGTFTETPPPNGCNLIFGPNTPAAIICNGSLGLAFCNLNPTILWLCTYWTWLLIGAAALLLLLVFLVILAKLGSSLGRRRGRSPPSNPRAQWVLEPSPTYTYSYETD